MAKEFFEKFPSLKGKIEDNGDWITINQEFAEKTLLDKKRAKEIIMRWNKRTYMTGEYIDNLLRDLDIVI